VSLMVGETVYENFLNCEWFQQFLVPHRLPPVCLLSLPHFRGNSDYTRSQNRHKLKSARRHVHKVEGRAEIVSKRSDSGAFQ
jgi:hypothetical protein